MLRLGIVPYLNVQPLIWALDHPDFTLAPELPPVETTPLPPRQLADRLHGGEFDAAIVPIFEAFRHPAEYLIATGAAIAATGPVGSVILFADCPFDQITTVRLEPASFTSNNLLRVLFAELDKTAEFIELPSADSADAPLPPSTAQLRIGDAALRLRGRHTLEWDLAAAWTELTGLSFVFAAWVIPAHTPNPAEVADTLRAAKTIGLENITTIANESAPRFGFTPELALRYFTQNLSFELAAPEQNGIARFAELCAKHHLIPATPTLRFI